MCFHVHVLSAGVNRFQRTFISLTFIVFCCVANAQPTIFQKDAPIWVTPRTYSIAGADTTNASDGYAYLLVDMQNNFATKEFYRKYAMMVTSDAGLSLVASINETFDPSFQTITFHELNIIRKGQRIKRLDVRKFEVIRREEQLDRAIYDKTFNALYNIPDVRVGDIVEYSLTRKGTNPIFGNHSFGTAYLQYGVPVAQFAFKAIYNAKQPIMFSLKNDQGTHATEEKANMVIKEWVRENVPALLTDDARPSWHDPYARIEFSDFESWNEVKKWATSIYQYPKQVAGALSKEIARLKSSEKTEEEKVKECIRLVQKDVRYLSFSDGISGYKPHDPNAVFNQRYGDCKDKSFLLSFMLNSIGVESHCALVSTEMGYSLNDFAPQPYGFNHCIVTFNFRDSTYWVDPTLNPQVGKLNSFYVPSYYNALVLNGDGRDLTPIPFGYKNSKVDVVEEYSMYEVGGPVTLKVKSTYYGDEADEMRSYFNKNTRTEIDKQYLNFYAKDFSEIELGKSIAFDDDTVNNIMTSSEEYKLANFWTLKEGNKTATVYGNVITTYMKRPETRVRTMPLLIEYPREIYQTIKIRLPDEWNVTDLKTEIESDAFRYESSVLYADGVITLRYKYKSKVPFIDADKCADHITKIDNAINDTGYTIYTPLAKPSNNRGTAYIITFVVIAVGIFLVSRRRQPKR